MINPPIPLSSTPGLIVSRACRWRVYKKLMEAKMWVFTIIIVFSDLSPRSGDEHIKSTFYFGSKPTILGMEWKQAFRYKYILHWNAFIAAFHSFPGSHSPLLRMALQPVHETTGRDLVGRCVMFLGNTL